MEEKMAKALVLFSGGLDSQLACLLLMKEGIEVVPVFFETYFFKADKAKKYAEAIGLNLRVEDISNDHLEVVHKPPHGYGKHMNPCVDCHLLMIKRAKEIMEKEGFDFIATGEVLEERPFSQRAGVFEEMEEILGLQGKIVRPLSLKLLPETEAEKRGLINREHMLDIKGESRKVQLQLAKEFGLEVFETPASGCILTDPEYSRRLKTLKKINPNFDGNDAMILRRGRVFFENNSVIVIGRNELENNELERLKKPSDILLKPQFPGASLLIRSFNSEVSPESLIEKAITLIINYSKKAPQNAKDMIEVIK
jgi:tRNA U34 2-thiouridine synthase MnmA/TrmU